MKGLTSFVSELRLCQSASAEQARVLDELHSIRSKIAEDKQMGLQLKARLLWRLIYIELVGYRVDFGCAEALSLLSSLKYSEHATGYVFFTIINRQFVTTLSQCVSCVKIDLLSSSRDFQILALRHIPCFATPENASDLFPSVQSLANPSCNATNLCRQNAYVAMTILFQLRQSLMPSKVWIPRLTQALMFERDIGCLLAITHLVIVVILHPGSGRFSRRDTVQDTTVNNDSWATLQPSVIHCIARILSGDIPPEYHGHRVAAPWLTIRLLQLLRLLPPPTTQSEIQSTNQIIRESFQHVLDAHALDAEASSQSSGRRKVRFPLRLQSLFSGRDLPGQMSLSRRLGSAGKANLPDRARIDTRISVELDKVSRLTPLDAAILFETIKVAYRLRDVVYEETVTRTAALLCAFIITGTPDMQYTALSLMTPMKSHPAAAAQFDTILPIILRLSKGQEALIREQALLLLRVLSNNDNWCAIVDDLLNCVGNSNEGLQDKLIVTIASIVELHQPDFTWYIDIVFKLLEVAPHTTSDAVLQRAVQGVCGFVASDDIVNVQRYAAKKSYEYLQSPLIDERTVKLATYFLGEFGRLIKNQASGGSQITLIINQLRRVLSMAAVPTWSSCFVSTSYRDTIPTNLSTGCVALMAMVKLSTAFPTERPRVIRELRMYEDSNDLEMQTRAVELASLLGSSDEPLISFCFSVMPPYHHRRYYAPAGVVRGVGLRPRISSATFGESIASQNNVDGMCGDKISKDSFETVLGAAASAIAANEHQAQSTAIPYSSDSSSSSSVNSYQSESSDSQTTGDRCCEESPPSESDDTSITRLLPRAAASDTSSLWRRSCLLKKGMFFSSQWLELRARHSSNTPVVTLLIQWQCPNQEYGVTIENVKFLSQPSLAIDTEWRGSGYVLPPEGFVQQLRFTCWEPFNVIPTMNIQGHARSHLGNVQAFCYTVPLPVILSDFISPVKAAGDPKRFLFYWNKLGLVGREEQNVGNEAHAGGIQQSSVGQLAVPISEISVLLRAFNLTPLQIGRSICGAGTLRTATAHPSEPNKTVTACCMLKVDVDGASGLCRVIVRTAHPRVSSLLLDVVSSYVISTQVVSLSSAIGEKDRTLSALMGGSRSSYQV